MCKNTSFLKNGGKSLRLSFLVALILAESVTSFAITFGPPSKVESAFKEQFPSIESVRWETSDNSFIAKFREKNSIVKVFFDSLGNFLESEKEIPIEDLPEKVVLYLKTQDEGAKIIKAYKIEKNSRHQILYDVVARVQFKKSTFTISKDGYLTSR
jgi:hypothetical protein